ncbi:MAG TPA: hypothetical protein PLZ93_18030, partial [Nocardioides sp.]|nr:hypothetical protein [Nocardioides sp.]
MSWLCFVPPYLLRQIARHSPEVAEWVEQTLAHDALLRLERGAPTTCSISSIASRTIRSSCPGA